MKSVLSTICASSFVLAAATFSAQAADACKEPEERDPSTLDLPEIVKIPEGHKIHSAAMTYGCARSDNGKSIATDELTLRVITVPEEYSTIEDPIKFAMCGDLVGIRDDMLVEQEMQPPYLSRSDENYSISVTSLTSNQLDLGKEFLKSKPDCIDLFQEYSSEYIMNGMYSLAPKYFD